ncbi:MAG: DUF4335 domain-containing protein [Cyanophyceae cyanobacterium]
MTIRRQYSLPNCTLILEGLSNDSAAGLSSERPPLSLLVNAECRFVGIQQILSGGRDFLDSLVKAVSAYAQEYLSELPHPQPQEGTDTVSLARTANKNVHRLVWQSGPSQTVELDLTTVQLFDLVEAVDQLFADSQTLPELTLSLQPVSRRYRQAEEPLVQRAAPAALGTASVALAAIAFFFIPVPEVRDPEPVLESNPSETLPTPAEEPLPGASPLPPEEESPAN